MPAAVTETGKCIIFSQKNQYRAGTGAAVGGGKPGRVSRDIRTHGKPGGAQQAAEALTGKHFVIAGFRTGMNIDGRLTACIVVLSGRAVDALVEGLCVRHWQSSRKDGVFKDKNRGKIASREQYSSENYFFVGAVGAPCQAGL